MRVSAFLLATSVALVACSNNFATAIEAGAEMKTPTATPNPANQVDPTTNDDNVFVHSMPFKLRNVTGTMVITIDKDTLKKVSDKDMALLDSSNVFDFAQLEKKDAGSDDEERGLFMFVGTHFAQYKLTQKATSWIKSIF